MCVVVLVDDNDTRPEPDIIRAMFDSNGDGAGAAWREEVDGVPHVHWRKGLGVEDMVELAATLPVPYVQHFRIASCGGVRPELTHPFEISEDASVESEGLTTNPVLFHNGHWTGWERELKEAVWKAGGEIKLPVGPWSDTRAMAFLVHHFGHGYLDLANEKTIMFGPDGDIGIWGTFGQHGWSYYKGLYLVSNTHFAWRAEKTLREVKDNRSMFRNDGVKSVVLAPDPALGITREPAETDSEWMRRYNAAAEGQKRLDAILIQDATTPTGQAQEVHALSQRSFCRTEGDAGGEADQQESLSESVQDQEQARGQGVAENAQGASRREVTPCARTGSVTASGGGHRTDDNHSLSEAIQAALEAHTDIDPRMQLIGGTVEQYQRQEEARWARRICAVRNPKGPVVSSTGRRVSPRREEADLTEDQRLVAHVDDLRKSILSL